MHLICQIFATLANSKSNLNWESLSCHLNSFLLYFQQLAKICYLNVTRYDIELNCIYLLLTALCQSNFLLDIFACLLSFNLPLNFRSMVKYFLVFLVCCKVSNKYKCLHLLSCFRLGQLNVEFLFSPGLVLIPAFLCLFLELVLNCLLYCLIPLLYFHSI